MSSHYKSAMSTLTDKPPETLTHCQSPIILLTYLLQRRKSTTVTIQADITTMQPQHSAEGNSRGNMLKLMVNRTKNDSGNVFFSNRIVNVWKSLPNHVITATSFNQFIGTLDKFSANRL